MVARRSPTAPKTSGMGPTDLCGIGREVQELGPIGERRAGGVRVDHEGLPADEEHTLEAVEGGTHTCRGGWKHSSPQRVGRVEDVAAVERAAEHRRPQLARRARSLRRRRRISRPRPRRRPPRRPGDAVRRSARRSSPPATGRSRSPTVRQRRVHLTIEMIHANGHEHRAGRWRHRIVERPAQDRAELVRRSHLVRPLRHRPGEGHEIARQQRVVGQMALVLLARGDDQRVCRWRGRWSGCRWRCRARPRCAG